MDCRARSILVWEFILREISLPIFLHIAVLYPRCLRGARMLGPDGRRRGTRKQGHPHNPVVTRSLRHTESGATGTLGGRPLRTQAVRAPAREDKRCHDSGGRKAQKSGLGRDQGQTLRCHFGVSLESTQDLAQQERQTGQDLQIESGGERQSLRPQPEDHNPAAFLHETFEKVGKNLGEADELFD